MKVLLDCNIDMMKFNVKFVFVILVGGGVILVNGDLVLVFEIV